MGEQQSEPLKNTTERDAKREQGVFIADFNVDFNIVCKEDRQEDRAAQNYNDLDRLMREAAEAWPLLVQELEALARELGCDYEVGALKSVRRATDKVARKYQNNAAYLCDICRGMLIVDDDDMAMIQKIADYYSPQNDSRVKHVEDRLTNPTSSGFRSLNISIEMANGHIVEIMVLTRGMRQAYDKTHDLYEKASSLTNSFGAAAAQEEAKKIHDGATSPALKDFKLRIL